MDLYVGNLSYSVSESDLEKTFSKFGKVLKAKVIMDRDTGRSKGFGFVTMEDDQDAQDAIANLDGSELQQRVLKVNESKNKENSNSNRNSFDRNDNNSSFRRNPY